MREVTHINIDCGLNIENRGCFHLHCSIEVSGYAQRGPVKRGIHIKSSIQAAMYVDTSYLVPVQCASEASVRLQIRHFSAHISSSLTNGLHSRTMLQMKADEVELVLRHNWHCPLAHQASIAPPHFCPPWFLLPTRRLTESIHPPCCDCDHLPRGLTSPPFIQPPHRSSCHCLTN